MVEDLIKKEEIKKVLEKMKGSNILNFSKYVDESINSNDIKMILQLLDNEDLKEINDIKNRLLKYNEYVNSFTKDFEERKRNSIFEFSIISLVIIEREDFQTFEKERKKCPNRVDRILYHGTSIEEIKYQKKMIHLHLLLVQYITTKMVLEKLKIINILLKKMKLILHMQKKIFQLLKNIQMKINFLVQNM